MYSHYFLPRNAWLFLINFSNHLFRETFMESTSNHIKYFCFCNLITLFRVRQNHMFFDENY